MNVTEERSGQSPCAATTSSAPSPFWIVITVAPGERPLEPRRERLEVGALAGEDRELGVRGQRGGIGRRGEPRREVAAPGDAQALLAQRGGVLLPPRQHGHLGDAREMRGEEGADRAGAGYDDLRHASTATAPVSRWITG